MTHQELAVGLQLGIRAFDDPALSIALGIVAGQSPLAESSCAAHRRYGVADTPATQVVPESSTVVALVGDQMAGTRAELPGESAHLHRLQRGLSQMHLRLLGTVQMQAHGQSCIPL